MYGAWTGLAISIVNLSLLSPLVHLLVLCPVLIEQLKLLIGMPLLWVLWAMLQCTGVILGDVAGSLVTLAVVAVSSVLNSLCFKSSICLDWEIISLSTFG